MEACIVRKAELYNIVNSDVKVQNVKCPQAGRKRTALREATTEDWRATDTADVKTSCPQTF